MVSFLNIFLYYLRSYVHVWADWGRKEGRQGVKDPCEEDIGRQAWVPHMFEGTDIIIIRVVTVHIVIYK